MKTCFVAMPISTPQSDRYPYDDVNHFVHVFRHLFDPAIRAVDYEPVSPLSTGSELIHAEVIRNLHEADLVLCDMSTLNANVLFELGIRTALDKPVCLVADRVTPDMPFDAGIINRHTYEPVLRVWNIEEEKRKLIEHLQVTLEKANGRNSLWRHFGIETSGKLSPSSYSESDKLDHLIQMLNGLTRENAFRKQKRAFNISLDALRVNDWAVQHRAKNAFDLGPRNFERCLFDLDLEGGIHHELSYNEDDSLKYQ